MRARTLVPIALLLFPTMGWADDKADCFDAAEKAQHLRNDKKLTEARQPLLTCSRDICPQQVRQDCVKWLNELDASTSTIVVQARDAQGKDLIDVKVYVDGKLLTPKLEGTAISVDPGAHKFRYELPDGTSQEDDVLVAEGEKNRVLRVDIKGAGGGSSAQTGGNNGNTPPPGGEQPATKGGGPGPVPWIIGAVGLASLIGFGIIEIPIQSQYSDLKNGCGATQSCTQAQESSLTSLYAPGAILLGVGIAGVVVGATWLIIAAATSHPANHPTTGFGVAPMTGGAFATFARSF